MTNISATIDFLFEDKWINLIHEGQCHSAFKGFSEVKSDVNKARIIYHNVKGIKKKLKLWRRFQRLFTKDHGKIFSIKNISIPNKRYQTGSISYKGNYKKRLIKEFVKIINVYLDNKTISLIEIDRDGYLNYDKKFYDLLLNNKNKFDKRTIKKGINYLVKINFLNKEDLNDKKINSIKKHIKENGIISYLLSNILTKDIGISKTLNFDYSIDKSKDIVIEYDVSKLPSGDFNTLYLMEVIRYAIKYPKLLEEAIELRIKNKNITMWEALIAISEHKHEKYKLISYYDSIVPKNDKVYMISFDDLYNETFDTGIRLFKQSRIIPIEFDDFIKIKVPYSKSNLYKKPLSRFIKCIKTGNTLLEKDKKYQVIDINNSKVKIIIDYTARWYKIDKFEI